MGRGKLNMELICKERSRILTFKKRKEGLVKKLHELTTLCDVSACMIIYGPTQENTAAAAAAVPEIWPENPDEIRRIIDVYRSRNRDSGSSSTKPFGLSDFFKDRKKKAEEELVKLRKKNVEAKYPTWDEFLNFLNTAELGALAASLNGKAQIVKSRIDFLKRMKQESGMVRQKQVMIHFAPATSNLSQSQSFYPLNQDQEIKPVNLSKSHSFYPLTHDQEIKPVSMVPTNFVHDQEIKPIGMVPMSYVHDQQIRPISMVSMNYPQHNSSGNFASFEWQAFYDQAAAATGHGPGIPMICQNPMPLAHYPPPMLQPMVQPYMPWSGVAPPAQFHQLPSNENLN